MGSSEARTFQAERKGNSIKALRAQILGPREMESRWRGRGRWWRVNRANCTDVKCSIVTP